jgi:hypothetical protein
MAINVDDVYKTVLLILNKEQRGYITPAEFNKIATQVQLEIFENYFQYENRQYRVPDNESEYSDRYKNVDEKIAIFKELSDGLNKPIDEDYFEQPDDLYKLGTVIYTDAKGNQIEVQKSQQNDFLYVDTSPLTKPSEKYPIYLYRNNRIYVKPNDNILDEEVKVSYLRKPKNPRWGYDVDLNTGGYIYDDTEYDPTGNPPYPDPSIPEPPYLGSTNFELHETEQTELIIKILMYSGVVIRDPQIIQTAGQMDQQETAQENS